MSYELPTSVTVCGTEYAIRSDYRAVLDILAALSDPDLDGYRQTAAVLSIFYPDFINMPVEHERDAINACIRFINGGEDDDGQKFPRLVDWDQDFPLIVGAVNRVLGKEIRSLNYLHWWSMLSAYMEIGDCTFAQVVSIRDKQARHKPLDKAEKEWLRRNRNLVEFKHKYTHTDNELLKQWI